MRPETWSAWLEATILGATAVGLNVFATNRIAQELCRKLGYATTNLNMSKPLP
jgi:hypothetical protein